MLRLGLIGDNIAQSQAPRLHRLAGAQSGRDVRYDSLVPPAMGQDFDAVFAHCRAGGYDGVNVTFPYKERVTGKVRIDDPLVRAIGAVNTVIFGPAGPAGYNTDHSGFVRAYRDARGATSPGVTLLIGTGGVGRAVAFGLVALGAPVLRLADRDIARAQALADDIAAMSGAVEVEVCATAEAGASGVEGLVNCTPVGMVGYPGTALNRTAIEAPAWAFDAVYTPPDTQFLADARDAGATPISGWELFFWQGVHAWRLFAGTSPDTAALRAALLAADTSG